METGTMAASALGLESTKSVSLAEVSTEKPSPLKTAYGTPQSFVLRKSCTSRLDRRWVRNAVSISAYSCCCAGVTSASVTAEKGT